VSPAVAIGALHIAFRLYTPSAATNCLALKSHLSGNCQDSLKIGCLATLYLVSKVKLILDIANKRTSAHVIYSIFLRIAESQRAWWSTRLWLRESCCWKSYRNAPSLLIVVQKKTMLRKMGAKYPWDIN